MHLFVFEPGDGTSYRVLFGRLPASTPLIPYYTVFGIAEGSSEPGMWYAFDNDRVSEDIFHNHINAWGTLHRTTFYTAWLLWLALTGQEDDYHARGHLDEWRADWRRQLPAART